MPTSEDFKKILSGESDSEVQEFQEPGSRNQDRHCNTLRSSVSDLYSLNPDPAKNLNPDPGPDTSNFLPISEFFFN